SRPEDSVHGAELFDPTRVPGVQGCLVGGQQRAKLFLSRVLRPGNSEWHGGKKRERRQQRGKARAGCHWSSESVVVGVGGGAKATSSLRRALSRLRPRRPMVCFAASATS